MRAIVRVTVIRDIDGYQVVDYGPERPGRTLLGAPPSGIHIVGVSGRNESVTYSLDQNLRLWKKIVAAEDVDGVAAFMSRWGSLDIFHTVTEPKNRFDTAYILLEPLIQGLQYLAKKVEAFDPEGFSMSLRENAVFHGKIAVDVATPGLLIFLDARSFYQFLIFEMWNEFGGERPAHQAIRRCSYCSRTFRVGGRRSNTRRTDAKYCSDSCRNMASRARVTGRSIKEIQVD